MRVRLDIPLSLTEVINALHGTVNGVENTAVFSYVCTDTREIREGDLFFALRGEKFNGEDFVSKACSLGAVSVCTEYNEKTIIVKDTAHSLLTLASYYKTKLKKLVSTVAITGSVGKTTTKEFLKIIMSKNFLTHATEGNMNNSIGVPLTVLSSPKNTEILILEMGMNHKGEISELSRCAKPDVAVITNIGTSHIGNLGSRKNIAEAKMEITDGMKCKTTVIPYGEKLLCRLNPARTFSQHDPNADIYIIYNEGKVKINCRSQRVETFFAPLGVHYLECLGAAIAAADLCGVDIQSQKEQISAISDKNIRQSIILIHDFFVLSDYYNASFESVKAAIKHLSSLHRYTRKSAVLGDILELGNLSEQIHYKIGKECAANKIESLYLFGEFSEFIEAGATDFGMPKEHIFLNRDLSSPQITASQIISERIPGEIILFKASHAIDLGRVLKILKSTVI